MKNGKSKDFKIGQVVFVVEFNDVEDSCKIHETKVNEILEHKTITESGEKVTVHVRTDAFPFSISAPFLRVATRYGTRIINIYLTKEEAELAQERYSGNRLNRLQAQYENGTYFQKLFGYTKYQELLEKGKEVKIGDKTVCEYINGIESTDDAVVAFVDALDK